jgi:hypothetical protein
MTSVFSTPSADSADTATLSSFTSTPIEARVQELTNRYYGGLEVLQALDEPRTVDELPAELELDTDVVHDRIAYLSTVDRVRRDGGTVRPVE